MRITVFLLFLASTVAGCASTPTANSVQVSPSAFPTALPRPTSPAPTSAPIAATLPPPTRIVASSPTVLTRFNLMSMPGEGRAPNALAMLEDTLYVANRNSDNVALIRNGRVQAFIPTASGPTALLADEEHSRVYLATYYTPTISIIENEAISRTAVLSESVQSLAFANGRLLAGLGSSATIQIRDPVSLELKGSVKLSQGFDVLLMVVDAPRNRLLVNSYGFVTVLDLDTLSQVSSFEAPYIFDSLAVDPKDGTIWAGIFDDKQSRGYLVAYDINGRVVRTVALGADLRGTTVDSHGRIYVANSFLNQVDVVEGGDGKVIGSIPVGVNPTALVLDDAERTLYVASESSDNVTAIDATTLKRTALIPVGLDIASLLANEERSRVYAVSSSTDSVFVLEHGQVVDQVTVGHHPIDLARDPSTDRLFVANYGDGTLSIIDEDTLRIQSTSSITRSLTTVSVDPINKHLFADSSMFSLDTLARENVYLANGPGIFQPSEAQLVRANPSQNKIYVFASNGIPGSNSRIVLYAFPENDLAQSKMLPYRNGGNITAMAIDAATHLVYGASTHPLSYKSALMVWNAADEEISELPLTSRTSGMVINPVTSHLFLSHDTTYEPVPGALNKRDNAIQILDTRSFGEVGWLDVPGGPGPMALLDGTVYVAGKDDGAITIIGDAPIVQPPAPTQTFTPTPYPSSTPNPTATHGPPSTAPGATPAACAYQISPFAVNRVTAEIESSLGCPTSSGTQARFAVQQFEHGAMYYVDDEKQILVMLDAQTWRGFDDTWSSELPEDTCPSILVQPPSVKPKRGFGKVWCEQEAIREKIGSGESPEIGLYTAPLQHFQHGVVFGPPDAEQVRVKKVFVLLQNGMWN